LKIYLHRFVTIYKYKVSLCYRRLSILFLLLLKFRLIIVALHIMKFIKILFGLLCISAYAEGQVFLQQLDKSVFLARSEESSAKALIVDMGENLLLIDALYGSLAEGFSEKVKAFDKPVEYLINTHYHGDHTQGNILFRNVKKIAHHHTVQNIIDSAQYGPQVPPFSNQDLADIIVYDSLSLKINNQTIHIWHFGPSHTDGDLVVYLKELNIIHLGDIMLAPGALPYSISPEGLVYSLEEILKRITKDTKVVVGHGDFASKSDVEALLKIVKETIKFTAGKSESELKNYPKSWDEWNTDFIDITTWLNFLSKSLN